MLSAPWQASSRMKAAELSGGQVELGQGCAVAHIHRHAGAEPQGQAVAACEDDGAFLRADFMVHSRVIETRQAAHPNVYGATHRLDAPDKPRAGVPVLKSHEV